MTALREPSATADRACTTLSGSRSSTWWRRSAPACRPPFIDPALERKQIARVQAVRARRDSAAVEQALDAVRAAAAQDRANLIELQAAASTRAGLSVGPNAVMELVDAC